MRRLGRGGGSGEMPPIVIVIGTLVLALNFAQIAVLALTAEEIEAERSGWNVDPETQYHIQTDEGPERYFRFQTLNGQYRKEKRLQDGTVVGTEGWLDQLGFLRIKDYIADAKGFRILKSKMIYVGKDRPIQDAVSISKTKTSSSSSAQQSSSQQQQRPRRPVNPFRQPELKDFSSNSIESSKSYEASTTTPLIITPPPSRSKSQIVAVTTLRPRPFALTSGYLPAYNNRQNQQYRRRQQQKPALLVEPPPYLDIDQDQNHLASQPALQVHVVPPPPPPPAVVVQPQASSPGSFRGHRRYNATMSSRSDTVNYNRPASSSNNNSYRSRSRRPSFYNSRQSTSTTTTTTTTTAAPVAVREYEFPSYDGVASSAEITSNNNNNNGFQYYLKKQYHEEERQSPDKAVGSYGYVDPFGIRRVVYYKADGQNGFQHRKNNRYVGHDAQPYDPQPIAAEQAID
ncbi:nuclear transcription factor Y subunit gamma [Trichogramma pretiosum]|uniref:nuclear transcription factor Y subunit gamma n=1 Tax=Trichogramma pretiosum TaxID=7493 RepID=UPI000C71ADCB|nr:nuclear transcription factor Y subunit gamma [Trichogramma pretiosum]